uniref:Uncharacterized protein n=1 Tax=Arundo donax TaxID=35708 RepID=A0A0A8YPU0_ARUDO
MNYQRSSCTVYSYVYKGTRFIHNGNNHTLGPPLYVYMVLLAIKPSRAKDNNLCHVFRVQTSSSDFIISEFRISNFSNLCNVCRVQISVIEGSCQPRLLKLFSCQVLRR